MSSIRIIIKLVFFVENIFKHRRLDSNMAYNIIASSHMNKFLEIIMLKEIRLWNIFLEPVNNDNDSRYTQCLYLFWHKLQFVRGMKTSAKSFKAAVPNLRYAYPKWYVRNIKGYARCTNLIFYLQNLTPSGLKYSLGYASIINCNIIIWQDFFK